MRQCKLAVDPLTAAWCAQVTVYPSALAEDGSGAAASVAVSGGNRVRLTDGAALLKDVRLTADAPGTFLVTIGSASRRVSCHRGRMSRRHRVLSPSSLFPLWNVYG